MVLLPRGFDPVAAEAYVNTPMTAAERVKFQQTMMKAANLDDSIWNPLNPRGRCYNPNYRPPMPKVAPVVVKKPTPQPALVMRSSSPAISKLNPMAAPFGGSRTPPADANPCVQAQVVAKPVSMDSEENIDRWAKFLRLDPPPKPRVVSTAAPLNAVQTPQPVVDAKPIAPVSSSFEPPISAAVKVLQLPTPSPPPALEVKHTTPSAPTQTILAVSSSPITEASQRISAQPTTPLTSQIAKATTMSMTSVLPPVVRKELSRVADAPKTTDANIQNVWLAWMNGGKLPKKTEAILPTSEILSNKDAVAVGLHPVIPAGVESSVPIVVAAEIKSSVLPESASATIPTQAPRSVTPPVSSTATVAIKRSPEAAALQTSSDAFHKLLITGAQPATSFNRDAYRKHPHEVSPSQSRMTGLKGSASPTSNKSKTSNQSDKVNNITICSQPIKSEWRHPWNNPRFKITEDSSVFIAHIQNTTCAGKTYTATKKDSAPKVETALAKQSQDAPTINATSGHLKSENASKNADSRTVQPMQPVQTLQPVQEHASAPTAKLALKSTLFTFAPRSELTEVAKDILTNSKTSVILEQPSPVKSPQQTPQNSGPWQLHPSLVEILKDETKYAKWLGALTEAADSATTGFHHSIDAFDDDKVSDEGVTDIRAEKGNNAQNQLQDWDGSWGPAPVDWEAGRSFDDSFVPEYIKDWVKQSPAGPSVRVDLDAAEFILGEHPVSNATFSPPARQPETVPDSINSEDEKKRLSQTAQNALDGYNNKMAKVEERKNSWRRAQELRYQAIEREQTEGTPDLFTPAIDLYVRPAELKDAAAIRDIYNYYVVNTIIPEDQTEITLEVAKNLIQYSKNEKLPLLVAIHGKLPPVNTAITTNKNQRGRAQPQTQKIILPEQEHVIGFASTEHAAFGLFGSPHGLHRYTADLKMYVDIEYTRKGVGRNLMDHLIHILHFGYGFRNSCRFINQNNDPVYEIGGSGRWHMMNFRIPALEKNDPTLPWLSHWLKNKFKFLPGGCLKSWGRTATKQGPARFVDIHIIQSEAAQEGDFDVNC